MDNLIETEDLENANRAASLSRIQVRKPKSDPNTLQTPARKAGDITDRLAQLSEELEADVLQENRPATTPQAVQRPRLRNTGWNRPQKAVDPKDILAYWMEIRNGRRYPSWESLDPAAIGRHWPNCILVHCNKDIGRLQVKYEFTNAVRQAIDDGIEHDELIERIEFTPMVIDWILGLARDVALTGKPTHGTENFPSFKGEYPLRVIALPLSDDLRSIDHVLCHIQLMN